MSDFKVISGMIGGQAIDATSTTPNHRLGQVVRAIDMSTGDYGVGEFVYAKGAASTVVGSVVNYLPDGHATALAVANSVGAVALSMSANVASSYGWDQISGLGDAKSLAGNADNAAQYLTATAGSVDDAVVAGDRVHSFMSASAVGTPSAGLVQIELQYPLTNDIAD